jgi:putative restriction endonuclease
MYLQSSVVYVANTDGDWFRHFRPANQIEHVDEVNFWRPRSQQRFHALEPGRPFFFRLKHPTNAIVGFGFFAVQSFMSVSTAWRFFGEKNGAPTVERFLNRLARYRGQSSDDIWRLATEQLNCLILREAVFLPEHMWLDWTQDAEWARNIVAGKTYDLGSPVGQRLQRLMYDAPTKAVPDLEPQFTPLVADEREFGEYLEPVRFGQGTFRARLLNAYQGRCAVTGEKSVPVLDAAHIQPYRGPASNHIQNGLLLRVDLHRLYDFGYVTVTPDYRLEVSHRLKEEFDNGEHYFQMRGISLTLPDKTLHRPSRDALEWHATNVFK